MSLPPKSQYDAKDLMHDVFQMEDITAPDCRTVFMDWALSRADLRDSEEALKSLIAHYEPGFPHHPMIAVLKEGLVRNIKTGRRGGWRSRAR